MKTNKIEKQAIKKRQTDPVINPQRVRVKFNEQVNAARGLINDTEKASVYRADAGRCHSEKGIYVDTFSLPGDRHA